MEEFNHREENGLQVQNEKQIAKSSAFYFRKNSKLLDSVNREKDLNGGYKSYNGKVSMNALLLLGCLFCKNDKDFKEKARVFYLTV